MLDINPIPRDGTYAVGPTTDLSRIAGAWLNKR